MARIYPSATALRSALLSGAALAGLCVVPSVAAATVDAFRNGQITQPQYDQERALIGRYQKFFASQPPPVAPTAPKPATKTKGAAAPAASLTPGGDQP